MDSLKAFAAFLYWNHKLKPADVELTGTPGYWRIRKPCKGAGRCGNPLHATLFGGAPMQHTVYYEDRTDTRGAYRCRAKKDRFRTWMYFGGVIR